MAPYFGLRGGWLTFWVTVACTTDMTLFGYDKGVFGKCSRFSLRLNITNRKQAVSLSQKTSSTLSNFPARLA